MLGNTEKPQELLEKVDKDICEFVKDAPQFDDLTMLCLKYNGPIEEEKIEE